jgi:hypothetical protein
MDGPQAAAPFTQFEIPERVIDPAVSQSRIPEIRSSATSS